MTVRPSCHNVRTLRHMRNLQRQYIRYANVSPVRYKCRPFTLFINCFVQLCRSVDHSSMHNECQFVTSFRSVRT